MKNIISFDLEMSPVEGSNLIEASAGTGKTYTITGLIIRYILEYKIPHDRILVVTFTEAATKELKDRIRKRLKEVAEDFVSEKSDDPFIKNITKRYSSSENLKKIKDIIKAFDQVHIYTIHGFSRKILLEYAFESHTLFDPEIVRDQSLLLGQIADDFYRKNFNDISLMFAGYAFTKKINPDYFKSLLNSVAGKVSLKILPEEEIVDFRETETKYEKCFLRAAFLWEQEKERIKEILDENPSLNRNRYRLTKLFSVYSNTDALFSSGPTPIVFKDFEKFTNEYMEKSVKKGMEKPEHYFFDMASELTSLNEQLEEIYERHITQLKRKVISEGVNELEKIKLKRNVIGFDDMLLRLQKALMSDGGSSFSQNLQKKFNVAMIDEFQDTDPVQYDIFRRIFRNCFSLFFIGDPKQAIYSFRGADIYSYKNAFYDADTIYTLKKNYRSEKGLVNSVNTIFSANKNPFFFDWIDFKKAEANNEDSGESPFNIWFLDSQKFANNEKGISKETAGRVIAEKIAREIILLTMDEKRCFSMGDMAILVRTNREADFFKDILESYRIGAVIHSNSSVFDSSEAKDLSLVLKAFFEPENRSVVKTALSTEIMGYSLKEISLIENDDQNWEKILSSFKNFSNIWKKSGFTRMIKEFLTAENVLPKLTSFKGGERKATNIIHLVEILSRYDSKDTGAEKLIKWFDEMSDPSSSRDDEGLLRLSGDENLVKIVTIHKSKGMQYPVVFVPTLYNKSKVNNSDSHFFFHGDNNEFCIDIGSDSRKTNLENATSETLAENIRLAYVALTRAEKKCYLAWGRIGDYTSSSLSYLLHGKESKDFPDSVLKLSDEDLICDLKRLTEISNGDISLSVIKEDEKPERDLKKEAPPTLQIREFRSNMDNSFGVSSFSALSSHGKSSMKSSDFGYLYEEEEKSESENDIFSFPKGNVPGLFMHEILEDIDYKKDDPITIEKVIEEKLEKYGFEPLWKDTIFKMVKTLIDAELDSETGLRLSKISDSERINELEFYFPVNNLYAERLNTLLEGSRQLGFQNIRGYLKGYIDLIIRYRNKFYIFDWKSNHLGNKLTDYRSDNLKNSIMENYYDLQYHIYTVALNRYLKKTIDDYDYQRDFGGVFYIFLRGLSENHNTGIFMDKPDPELVEKFDSVISRGGEI